MYAGTDRKKQAAFRCHDHRRKREELPNLKKLEHPRSNLASKGIYIFSWERAKESLTALKDQPSCDFENTFCRTAATTENVCLRMSSTATERCRNAWLILGSKYGADRYYSRNSIYMRNSWKIYTKGDRIIRPQYVSWDAVIDRCIIGEGAENLKEGT